VSFPQQLDPTRLNAAGLNLRAVFNMADLPPALRAQVETAGHYRQLILIGHGGRRLWEAVQASGIVSADPIDEFTVQTVSAWFAECQPGVRHTLIYPGAPPVGLQKLGELAGWHHPSPFMVGINAAWGSWYAYRAVLLADSNFTPTTPVQDVSPCLACAGRVCVAACPGGALGGDSFALEACIAWRRRPDSSCRTSCLARLACPVASEHRYCGEQIRHSYGISLRMIEQYY